MPKSKKTRSLKVPDDPLGNTCLVKQLINFISSIIIADSILRRNLYMSKYAKANDLQHHLGKFN